MPGMNSGLDANDPYVVAAFRSALAHQGLIALLIIAVVSIAWVAFREWPNAETKADGAPSAAAAVSAEATGRQVLRVGFGLLWLLDAVLATQASLPVGLPSGVIEPTAADSSAWVQHLVNWAGTTWSYHPVQAAAASVWIQAGIGLWLIAAQRGTLSRLAGVASVGWGLVIWTFGESFGGIFAPGLSWLTGAPGAALAYVVAGVLLALPERSWRRARLGKVMLAGLGLFLIGMAVLQAWPGRGFWQGATGPLTGAIQSGAQASQPSFIASLLSGFATFVGGHGFAVNLVAVILMAALGAALLAGLAGFAGSRVLTRTAVWVFVAFCLADWILVEDLGFFGGLGTNPGSMIPMALLGVAGYVAATQGAVPDAAAAPLVPTASWRERLDAARQFRPAGLRRWAARATFGTAAACCALGVIVIGVVPIASAQADPSASTILAEAVDGQPGPVDYAAPSFSLTDQAGKTVSLADLRGKVVLLTFLDPVCVSDCPLIAQEFKLAGKLLGASGKQVELVAINLNPLYHSLDYVKAFDQQEGLTGVPNWLYLTGSPTTLTKLYASYGVASETLPSGAMLGHSDIAFAVDQSGSIRQELDFDPGPGSTATQSSFATELSSAATQLLQAS
jgi:cytochrome oxidase Cu insertion factor (SCO1/SenC/PrrC family)